MVKTQSRKKKKVEPAKEISSRAPEWLREMFQKYIETTSAIILDYVPDPGMLDELKWANENLKDEVDAVIEEFDNPPAEWLHDKISRLDSDDIDSERLLDVVHSTNAYSSDKVMDLLDDGDMTDHLLSKGYASIKIDNLAQRQKLEAFVKAEIWPNYNEEVNYDI